MRDPFDSLCSFMLCYLDLRLKNYVHTVFLYPPSCPSITAWKGESVQKSSVECKLKTHHKYQLFCPDSQITIIILTRPFSSLKLKKMPFVTESQAVMFLLVCKMCHAFWFCVLGLDGLCVIICNLLSLLRIMCTSLCQYKELIQPQKTSSSLIILIEPTDC